MNSEASFNDQVNKLITDILNSPATKKLVVAGPGTGKTTLFKKAINNSSGYENDHLALTFINNLEDELKKELEGIAKVYTFHGYCHYLLINNSALRFGLKERFHYYPPLIHLVIKDWIVTKTPSSPQFINEMRNLSEDDSVSYFTEKGNYYNAVGYDDSIYRVFKALSETVASPKE
ncbi:MAG: UvrD-helicase domain-containing protein [Patescibacteria group bacterium]